MQQTIYYLVHRETNTVFATFPTWSEAMQQKLQLPWGYEIKGPSLKTIKTKH